MIFTSQLGTKPLYLTPLLAPLTPLLHTKAKSQRPKGGPDNGGGGAGTIQGTEKERRREMARKEGE